MFIYKVQCRFTRRYHNLRLIENHVRVWPMTKWFIRNLITVDEQDNITIVVNIQFALYVIVWIVESNFSVFLVGCKPYCLVLQPSVCLVKACIVFICQSMYLSLYLVSESIKWHNWCLAAQLVRIVPVCLVSELVASWRTGLPIGTAIRAGSNLENPATCQY
ncbi:uncharacterized protein EV154DRAFT_481887 [Mucor mucedo]|uniref:uncharacterized protein n=1 Tax=Mucor mucedo TaxID=29922 RepID=UPI00221F9DCB|nr:uncharacterized protein EV154DRAFT_481887 [Mucor mucedo]KAI7890758.1 hypothetical protein EV154DRAFT_481887 [Mucor mucedo]